jgi:hypothetical protein
LKDDLTVIIYSIYFKSICFGILPLRDRLIVASPLFLLFVFNGGLVLGNKINSREGSHIVMGFHTE